MPHPRRMNNMAGTSTSYGPAASGAAGTAGMHHASRQCDRSTAAPAVRASGGGKAGVLRRPGLGMLASPGPGVLAPDLAGGLDDEAELGHLLVVGQRVAL